MSHFFAYLSRMKLIQRWSLMRNTRIENVQEHSLQVAIVAHALGLIGNKYFDKKYNVEKVALFAIFHDATEVLTGDLPTPVKYFNSDIKAVYKEIESDATKKLLSFLPKDLQIDYEKILTPSDEERELWRLVKGADSICAYTKCLEEQGTGNKEFNRAKIVIEESLRKMKMPEVDYFMKNFITSFSLSLDDMSL